MTEKLRAVIIGLGWAGRAHAEAYQKATGIELVAVCDQNAAFLEEQAAAHGVRRRYTDYRQMLAAERPDIVSICVPNALHAEVTLAALEAGAHVLCEKPLAPSLAEAEAMLAAARRASRELAICYNYRYRDDMRWLRDLVQAGRLGEIYHVEVAWRRESGIPGYGWFINKTISGGGALIDIGVHMLDLARWMLDFPAVETVSAVTRSCFGPRGRKFSGYALSGGTPQSFDVEVEDGAIAFVRLDGGVSFVLQATWAEHRKPAEDIVYVELQGSEGTGVVNLVNYRESQTHLYTEIDGTPVEVTPALRPLAHHGHLGVVTSFVESIRAGTRPPTDAAQGVIDIKVLEAMYRSSREGREIRLDA